jgi:hypothetical protein
MADAGPSVGEVWRYPFLWSREAARGETEGRKPRPVAMALLTRNAAGEREVLMVPITSRPPRDNPFALPVPDIEKQRAGLDLRLALWIVTDQAMLASPPRTAPPTASSSKASAPPSSTRTAPPSGATTWTASALREVAAMLAPLGDSELSL